jgi:hypothetical protein
VRNTNFAFNLYFVINFAFENLITVTETQHSKINNRTEGIMRNVVTYSCRLKAEILKQNMESRLRGKGIHAHTFRLRICYSPPYVRIRARHWKGQYRNKQATNPNL